MRYLSRWRKDLFKHVQTTCISLFNCLFHLFPEFWLVKLTAVGMTGTLQASHRWASLPPPEGLQKADLVPYLVGTRAARASMLLKDTKGGILISGRKPNSSHRIWTPKCGYTGRVDPVRTARALLGCRPSTPLAASPCHRYSLRQLFRRWPQRRWLRPHKKQKKRGPRWRKRTVCKWIHLMQSRC